MKGYLKKKITLYSLYDYNKLKGFGKSLRRLKRMVMQELGIKMNCLDVLRCFLYCEISNEDTHSMKLRKILRGKVK